MDLVILAGSIGHDAPWTQERPRPLLPVPRKTLLESLISRFDFEGAGKCVICSNGHTEQLMRCTGNLKTRHLVVSFLEDGIPLGTAGCLKACESRTKSDTIFLAGGAVWLEDDPRWMVQEHRRQGNALTVFCTRDAAWAGTGIQNHLRPAGIFCCERSVLDHIRTSGFQDLKEQLVPALHRAGLRVGAVPLRADSCEISDQGAYMRVIARVLSDERFAPGAPGFTRIAPDIWCGRNVRIAADGRVVGPVLLGHGCRIDECAVVVGPTILGDGCHVGRDAFLIRVVAPNRLRVRPGVSLTDRLLPMVLPPPPGQPQALPQRGPRSAAAVGVDTSNFPAPTVAPVAIARGIAAAGILFGVFIWAFWPTVAGLWTFFARNADYSAGQLVPAAAVYMVMTRWKRLGGMTPKFWGAGVVLFAMGVGANLFGRYFHYSSAENLSVVMCAVGIIASIAGREVCRRLWFPILFLFLMVPLPHTIHYAVLLPLQGASAEMANRVLETIGIPAVRSGHVLEVAGHRIAVAEACSGLRMALAFLIVTCVIAYVVKKPRWQKIVVLFSSVPIALACNVVRIVFSAFLFNAGREWLAQNTFHDGAGLIMMPAAVGLVYIEFWLLSNLVVPRSAVATIVEVCDDRVRRSPVIPGL